MPHPRMDLCTYTSKSADLNFKIRGTVQTFLIWEKRALTGILIYVSLKEHRAEIVADAAIAEKVSPEVWGDAMVALIDEIRDGKPGEGMAAAVKHDGVVLEEHFPKTDNNPNELPDRLIEI